MMSDSFSSKKLISDLLILVYIVLLLTSSNLIAATTDSNSTAHTLTQFNFEEIQKNFLDDDSVLLVFNLSEENSQLSFISKSEINFYILPSRQAIESKTKQILTLFSAPEKSSDETIEVYQERIARAEQEYPILAKELSNLLISQIVNKIDGKRLIIIPDGKLHYFPFSTLILPDSVTNAPLILSNEIIYLPSLDFLSQLSTTKPSISFADKDLIVFNDPVFTKEDSRLSFELRNKLNFEPNNSFRFTDNLNTLPRLTATQTEGAILASYFPQANIFTGLAANRENVLESQTSNYKIIHFATHGAISETDSGLSGLILSRYNEAGQELKQIIQVQDINKLKVKSDLVVLSACETAIGKEIKGQGLNSMSNAFLLAGAKTVVASLWKVEDSATQKLMNNFYKSLASNNTPSEALREAQISMWQNPHYKSPFYWAGFVTQGNFQTNIKFSCNSSSRFYPMFSVFIMIFLGILLLSFIVSDIAN